jgi:hypothetical protein
MIGVHFIIGDTAQCVTQQCATMKAPVLGLLSAGICCHLSYLRLAIPTPGHPLAGGRVHALLEALHPVQQVQPCRAHHV